LANEAGKRLVQFIKIFKSLKNAEGKPAVEVLSEEQIDDTRKGIRLYQLGDNIIYILSTGELAEVQHCCKKCGDPIVNLIDIEYIVRVYEADKVATAIQTAAVNLAAKASKSTNGAKAVLQSVPEVR
jgi:hypothetical protein